MMCKPDIKGGNSSFEGAMRLTKCAQIKGGNTTFKESLDAGDVPKSSALACDSLFSKYYFDVLQNETSELVDLTLNYCHSKDPVTGEFEKYASVGLLSSEDGKNHREPMNLLIALDTSCSMSMPLEKDKLSYSKLDLGTFCVKRIFNKLNATERVGVITFNESHKIILKIQPKSQIDEQQFFKILDKVTADGGSSFMQAYQEAASLMTKQTQSDSSSKSKNIPKNNRIMFITDAILNNQLEENHLLELNKKLSLKPKNLFTTFIGLGLDFDTDVVSNLTKVRGSNYFSIFSEEEFVKTLEEDFNYMVTPICFDVNVKIESSKYVIERTFGSDFDFDGKYYQSDGNVIRMETLVPYEKRADGVKGGVVLAKLKSRAQNKGDDTIKVTLEFEDIKGSKKKKQKKIEGKFKEEKEEYGSNGVRKALLLGRYVMFVKDVLEKKNEYSKGDIRREKFLTYFKEEMEFLKDKTLEEEYKNLQKIIHY